MLAVRAPDVARAAAILTGPAAGSGRYPTTHPQGFIVSRRYRSAMALVGILIVLASVAGGFAIAGGHFGVLIQPSEFVVIIGAAIGVLIATASGKMRSRVFTVLKHSFKDATPKKE